MSETEKLQVTFSYRRYLVDVRSRNRGDRSRKYKTGSRSYDVNYRK